MEHKVFVLLIANVTPWFAAVQDANTQIADQVQIRLISKLFKCISRVLKKLNRHFNGTIISTSFAPLLFGWLAIFYSKLNKLPSSSLLKSLKTLA